MATRKGLGAEKGMMPLSTTWPQKFPIHVRSDSRRWIYSVAEAKDKRAMPRRRADGSMR